MNNEYTQQFNSQPPENDWGGLQDDLPLPDSASITPPENEAAPSTSPSVLARFKGTLIDFGEAPFDFNDNEKLSFYVKIQSEAAPIVLWGIDLAEKIQELEKQHDGSLVGRELYFEKSSSIAVQTTDNKGNAIDAEKNLWTVDVVEFPASRLEAQGEKQDNTAGVEGQSNTTAVKDPDSTAHTTDIVPQVDVAHEDQSAINSETKGKGNSKGHPTPNTRKEVAHLLTDSQGNVVGVERKGQYLPMTNGNQNGHPSYYRSSSAAAALDSAIGGIVNVTSSIVGGISNPVVKGIQSLLNRKSNSTDNTDTANLGSSDANNTSSGNAQALSFFNKSLHAVINAQQDYGHAQQALSQEPALSVINNEIQDKAFADNTTVEDVISKMRPGDKYESLYNDLKQTYQSLDDQSPVFRHVDTLNKSLDVVKSQSENAAGYLGQLNSTGIAEENANLLKRLNDEMHKKTESTIPLASSNTSGAALANHQDQYATFAKKLEQLLKELLEAIIKMFRLPANNQVNSSTPTSSVNP